MVWVHEAAQILRLRWRPAASTPIQPLAWEPPYAVGVALTEKKQNKTQNPKPFFLNCEVVDFLCGQSPPQTPPCWTWTRAQTLPFLGGVFIKNQVGTRPVKSTSPRKIQTRPTQAGGRAETKQAGALHPDKFEQNPPKAARDALLESEGQEGLSAHARRRRVPSRHRAAAARDVTPQRRQEEAPGAHVGGGEAREMASSVGLALCGEALVVRGGSRLLATSTSSR